MCGSVSDSKMAILKDINGLTWGMHKFGRVYTPSQKVLQADANYPAAGDTLNRGSWNLYADRAEPLSNPGVAYCHNNQASVLYFDLHVKADGPNVLYGRYKNENNWLPYVR